MGNSTRTNELIDKVQRDGCSREELQELYQLLKREGTEAELEMLLEKGWDTLDPTVKMDQESTDEILDHLRKHVSKTRTLSVYRYLARIAASLLLVAASYFIFQSLRTKLSDSMTAALTTRTTAFGVMDSVHLEDGSVIWLNAGSKLQYPERFDKNHRTIYLTGEAFFQVTRDPGRPFAIHTGDVQTTVLGTSFNVKAYPEENDIQVTVATGKVLVESKQPAGADDAVILVPGRQTAFNKTTHQFAVTEALASDFSDWRQGVLHLDGTLRDAARVLSRKLDKTIVFENPDLANCRIRAKYDNQDETTILNSMKYILSVDYHIKNDTIVFSGKGCKETSI